MEVGVRRAIAPVEGPPDRLFRLVVKGCIYFLVATRGP